MKYFTLSVFLLFVSATSTAGVVWDGDVYTGPRPDMPPGPVIDKVKPDLPTPEGIIWPCARKGCPGWVQMPIEQGYMWLDKIKRSKK